MDVKLDLIFRKERTLRVF